jgi:two-component system sensor histidine kinase UhpB
MFPEIVAWRAIGAKRWYRLLSRKHNFKESAMPLRVRLIALIGLMLLASLAAGSVLVGWHAANSVRTELRAALNVGARTIRNGFSEMPGQDDQMNAMRHLVATFNGNRHVRAAWVDAQDQPLVVSELFVPTQNVPGWFRVLIGDEPGVLSLPVPPPINEGGAIVLRTDPINEIGEVWAQSRDTVLVLAAFAVLSAALTCAVIGQALRPLETLANAFDRIGKGNYDERVGEYGPPEITRLTRGFNVMMQRLATIAAQNRRLHERLLTLQAEERADLARDLHDEIGPLLFAIDMTAATIERTANGERRSDTAILVRSIQDAVAQMQRHVRVLLGRLRPIEAVRLAAAIDRLVVFWRSRRPDITFVVSVSIDVDRTDPSLNETVYRVVQESVSNAIRHAEPTQIQITIGHNGPDRLRVEVADDGIGMTIDGTTGRDPGQLGLIGMRERVMAMAGSLMIQRGPEGRGLAIIADLSCANSREPQNLDDPE